MPIFATLGASSIRGTRNLSSGSFYRGYFDYATSQYLSVANANGVNLSDNNNWTLEFYSYTTISSLNAPIIDKDGISGSRNSSYYLGLQTGTLFYYIGQGQGTSGPFIQGSASSAMPLNQWVHIAMVRNGTSFVLYQAGQNVGSGTIGFSMIDGGATFYVGHQQSQGNKWGGYMSNLRIVKGTSVYTSNFTPPTTPLTSISGTTLLTLNSATLVDNSGVGQTVSAVTSIPMASFGGYGSAP